MSQQPNVSDAKAMLAFFEDFGATLKNTNQNPQTSPDQDMTDAYEQFVADSKVSSDRFGWQASFMHTIDLQVGPRNCPHCKKSVPISSKCTSPRFGGIYHQNLIDIGSEATRA